METYRVQQFRDGFKVRKKGAAKICLAMGGASMKPSALAVFHYLKRGCPRDPRYMEYKARRAT
jgi:hypothetical protein